MNSDEQCRHFKGFPKLHSSFTPCPDVNVLSIAKEPKVNCKHDYKMITFKRNLQNKDKIQIKN